MDVSEVYCAIKENDTVTLYAYLDSLSNIKWEDTKFVDSLLYYAIYYNRYEILKKLVCTYHANPDNFNQWALILAKERASYNIMEFLLNKDFMKE